MRRSIFNRYLSDQTAAIAPLYALVIPALVVMGAIGFDYGRLMALDTELQNAADQAALAAATQLDGGDDAMIRARDAANNTFASAGGQFTNETRFANDGLGRPITSLSFEFYDGYADDTPGAEVEDDEDGADAKVVQVTVNARQVFYALTPLVGAINSGDVIGRAMATLQNATCNVPPMMFCVPQIDHDSNPLTPTIAEPGFPGADDVGKGLKLHFKTNGNADCDGNSCNVKDTTDTSSWAPGNFGFLDIDYGITGNDKGRTVGLNSDFLGCAGEAIETDPGFRTPQGAALNTRFDLFTPPINDKNACDADGNYCPGTNTRKDYTVTEVKTIKQKKDLAPPAAPNCGDYDTRTDYVPDTLAKGFTQDSCFANSSCGSSVVGTGAWDYATYLNAHHPGATAADFGKANLSEVTRFDVYSWELEDPATRLLPERISSSSTSDTQGANTTYVFTNVCSYPTPIKAAGLTPSDTQKDRRILTVAAVDCSELNGREEAKILRWVDLFLVRPVDTTANDRNFFAEIVGPAKQANGDSGFQYYGRKKAVLIR